MVEEEVEEEDEKMRDEKGRGRKEKKINEHGKILQQSKKSTSP